VGRKPEGATDPRCKRGEGRSAGDAENINQRRESAFPRAGRTGSGASDADQQPRRTRLARPEDRHGP